MGPLTFNHVKDMLLLGLLSLFVSSIRGQISELVRSVESLNINIAKLLERVDSHEHRISKIEDKL